MLFAVPCKLKRFCLAFKKKSFSDALLENYNVVIKLITSSKPSKYMNLNYNIAQKAIL